jgi:hypothetical protein
MRSMSQTSDNQYSTGFTLVEVLIIAPIVVLVIGGFVALMMALVGDVLLTRDQNVMAYETQDALDRIEQDTRIGTQFLDTSRSLTAPQGSNDGTTAFSSSNALIMGALATDKNPTSADRQLIYYADQPAPCGSSTQTQNRVFINKIIYYIKNGSLWRRLIVPPYNLNNPSDVLSVCAAPWQQNSCSPGYTLTPPCETNDSEVMKNIKTLEVKYYDNPSGDTELTGADILNATTIDVTITGERNTAGKVATTSGTVRASKLNSIDADIPPPTSPVVSHTVEDSPSPGVNFTWSSVPNATSYEIEWQVNGGGWTAVTLGAGTTSYRVNAFRTQTAAIRVASVNAAGTSPNSLDSAAVPSWTEMDTLNNWIEYAPSVFTTPAYTMTPSGVVMLKGMIKDGTVTNPTTLFVLPPGYRPANRLIFIVGSYASGSGTGRIDVMPTGEVYFINGTATWISLDNVHFYPSTSPPGVTPPVWTNLTLPTAPANWQNYPGYAPLQVAKDPIGRVHLNGLVRNGSTAAAGTVISPLPANYQPLANQHLLFPAADSGTVFSAFGVYNPGNAVVTRGLYNSYISTQAIYYPLTFNSWTNMTLKTSSPQWVNYGSPHSTAQYTKASDGIVTLKGLIRYGPTANGTVLTNLPAGFRPAKKLIFPVLGAASGSGGHVRIDVAPTGDVTIEGNGVNAYLALDSIMFMAEQ